MECITLKFKFIEDKKINTNSFNGNGLKIILYPLTLNLVVALSTSRNWTLSTFSKAISTQWDSFPRPAPNSTKHLPGPSKCNFSMLPKIEAYKHQKIIWEPRKYVPCVLQCLIERLFLHRTAEGFFKPSFQWGIKEKMMCVQRKGIISCLLPYQISSAGSNWHYAPSHSNLQQHNSMSKPL